MQYKLTHEESCELGTFLREVAADLQKDEKVTMKQAYTLKLKQHVVLTITRKRKKAKPPPPVDIFIVIDDENEKIKDISPDKISDTLKPYFENPSGAPVQSSPSFYGSRSAIKSPCRANSDQLVSDDDDDDDDDEAGSDIPPASGLIASADSRAAMSARTPISPQVRPKNSPARSTRGSVAAQNSTDPPILLPAHLLPNFDESAQPADSDAAAADSGSAAVDSAAVDSRSARTVELSAGVLTILQRLHEATDSRRKQKRKFDEICQNNPKKTNFEICMLFAEEVKNMKTPSDAQVKTFHGIIMEINALEEKYCEAKNKLIEAIRNAREALDELE